MNEEFKAELERRQQEVLANIRSKYPETVAADPDPVVQPVPETPQEATGLSAVKLAADRQRRTDEVIQALSDRSEITREAGEAFPMPICPVAEAKHRKGSNAWYKRELELAKWREECEIVTAQRMIHIEAGLHRIELQKAVDQAASNAEVIANQKKQIVAQDEEIKDLNRKVNSQKNNIDGYLSALDKTRAKLEQAERSMLLVLGRT